MDLKLVHKLSEADLKADHSDKMKVSTAKKIFNHSLSVAMHYFVSNKEALAIHTATAWFVEIVDHWFTLMTLRHPIVALN